MEGDGSFTHFAITAALTEREMAAQERRAEELACQRRQEYLNKVKADVNKYNELTARVNDELRSEREKFETKTLCLNSLKQVNEALVKEATELEQQLLKEKENSAAKQAEMSTLENSTNTLRRQVNSVTKKLKKVYGVWSLEKAVAALHEECEGKQATVNALDKEIREIRAAEAARVADQNKFIVKLAEVKVRTEANKTKVHEARAEVARLEAIKRALEEEERARSKSVAQVRALPQSHPTESPQSMPCAVSSRRQTASRIETSAIPSTTKQGSANQQSKGFPSRNVAPMQLARPQPSPQLLTSTGRLPEPPQPSTSSAQTPEPPQPSTSSAQTPEPNRASSRSARLGLSEYFDNVRTKLPTAPPPKMSADKRPGLGILKPSFPPPPSKQLRMEGSTTPVTIAPLRPIILPRSAPGGKGTAAPASPAPKSSAFFAASQSPAPRPSQEGASSIESAKVHQGPNTATQPVPLALAPPRPVRQHTSLVRHDARPDASPRSFPFRFRAENSTASQSAAPQPQGASDSGSPVSKHSSCETPRGHDNASPPATRAATPSRPIHQHTSQHRDASQPPRSPFPPKYQAQTFAAPQTQGISHTDLPAGRSPSSEAPQARTAATALNTLSTASSARGHQYASPNRRFTSPRVETFAAREGVASETQNSRPNVVTPVAERVGPNTAQASERSDTFSPQPHRIPPPSPPALPIRSLQRGGPATDQNMHPPSDQHALQHGWAPSVASTTQTQPAQSPTASSQWSSPPPTQATDTDQITRPLTGSPVDSEFCFGTSAHSSAGGGEDGFNLFGEDDDAGAGGGFLFSLAGAGSNPPRFNF